MSQKILIQTQSASPPSTVDSLTSWLFSGEGLAIGGLLLVAGIISLFNNNNSGKKNKLAKGRWAKAKDLKAAQKVGLNQIAERRHDATTVYLERPQTQVKGVPLFLPDMQRGTLIMGGPGSGKTDSGYLPMIYSALDQGYPAIVYDFKYPDLASKVAGLAAKRGYDVRIFAPGYEESEVCNPLDFLDPYDPSLMAGQFAKVLNRNFNPGDNKSDPFFSVAGDLLTQGVLMLAKDLGKERGLADIILCQALLSLDNLPKRLHQHKDRINYLTYLTFSNLLASAGSEKTVAGIVATASNLFTQLMKPKILSALVGKTTLPILLEGKQLLVIGLDQEKRDILAPLIASILDLIVARNCAIQRKDPLFFFLDEAPTLYLPRLVNWLNEMRSKGLCSVIGCQNIVQMEHIYGAELTKSIWGGCATKQFYNPQEPDSAKRVSETLGQEEIHFQQKSRSTGKGKGGASTTFAEQDRTRSLLDAADLLKFGRGERVLISPGFTSRKESYLPLREQVNFSPEFKADIEKSQQTWEKILPILRQKSSQTPITPEAMSHRHDLAMTAFPMSDDNNEGSNGTTQSIQNIFEQIEEEVSHANAS